MFTSKFFILNLKFLGGNIKLLVLSTPLAITVNCQINIYSRVGVPKISRVFSALKIVTSKTSGRWEMFFTNIQQCMTWINVKCHGVILRNRIFKFPTIQVAFQDSLCQSQLWHVDLPIYFQSRLSTNSLPTQAIRQFSGTEGKIFTFPFYAPKCYSLPLDKQGRKKKNLTCWFSHHPRGKSNLF